MAVGRFAQPRCKDLLSSLAGRWMLIYTLIIVRAQGPVRSSRLLIGPFLKWTSGIGQQQVWDKRHQCRLKLCSIVATQWRGYGKGKDRFTTAVSAMLLIR